MEDKIQSFRQPLVTATGIILGFILNFASSFVKTENDTSDFNAYLIGICILTGIICLIVTLARILKMNYPREVAEKYYQKTISLFIFGVSISFVGVLLDMFTNFMID
jgi:tellurite resistance protein TehA-like permease